MRIDPLFVCLEEDKRSLHADFIDEPTRRNGVRRRPMTFTNRLSPPYSLAYKSIATLGGFWGAKMARTTIGEQGTGLDCGLWNLRGRTFRRRGNRLPVLYQMFTVLHERSLIQGVPKR